MTVSSQPPSPGQQAGRHFRRRYFVALSLIAALAIAGQVLVQLTLNRQSGDSHVVNMAGYQRMLSQRLTLKILLFDPTQADASAQLDAIEAMRDRWVGTHRKLVIGLPDIAYGATAHSTLAALLDEAGHPLGRIAALAADLSPQSTLSAANRTALLADQELFLPLMDSVVLGLEKSASARVAFLQRVEMALLLITLVVLALEALLIFQPAVRRLQTSIDQLEHRNRQAAGSLASLRHLTGGIAHHFNNLLTGIMGHAELERLDALRDGRSTEYADAQLECGKRAAAIVTQLTRYSGEARYRCEPVTLGPWLRSFIPAGAPDNPDVRITLDIADDATVAIDRSALEPAVHGLLANAIEAMNGSAGLIQVRLTQAVLLEPRTMSGPYRAELPPGLYACLCISDNGEGIAASEFDRIFDPFYSQRGLGRGLGLASVLGIVHGHGGGICVESAPNRGSEVSVYLPLSGRTAGKLPPAAAKKSPSNGAARE
ncbi:hypothetical protein ESB00_10525 [Oleiharenicola lentus]|uniref:histidine kinase n=1 Tax=Oleiharenicola lentus TaxID=2508720 RepID=A0A4Q1CBJ3_9BACT|nr:hypothetical protein ESB00_10525 [Oleiharenicola lentus]